LKILNLIRNVLEISERKSRGLSPDSTSLPDVNLVDGLPSARHTEAVWGPHGVFGPAAIGTFDQKMYKIEQKCHMKLDRSFVQVKVCI
jgi:hypothetical protein